MSSSDTRREVIMREVINQRDHNSSVTGYINELEEEIREAEDLLELADEVIGRYYPRFYRSRDQKEYLRKMRKDHEAYVYLKGRGRLKDEIF